MTPADLRAWQAHMGLTYDTAAAALGVSRATYAEWVAGKSRTTGKPVTPSRLCALACAALAAGLEPWKPWSQTTPRANGYARSLSTSVTATGPSSKN